MPNPLIGYTKLGTHTIMAYIITTEGAWVYSYTPYPQVLKLAPTQLTGFTNKGETKIAEVTPQIVREYKIMLELLNGVANNSVYNIFKPHIETIPNLEEKPIEIKKILDSKHGTAGIAVGAQLPALFMDLARYHGFENKVRTYTRSKEDETYFNAISEAIKNIKVGKIKPVPVLPRPLPKWDFYAGLHMAGDNADYFIRHPDGSMTLFHVGYVSYATKLSSGEAEEFLRKRVQPVASRWGFFPLDNVTVGSVAAVFEKVVQDGMSNLELIGRGLKRDFGGIDPSSLSDADLEFLRREVEKRLSTVTASTIILTPTWELVKLGLHPVEGLRASFDLLTNENNVGLSKEEVKFILHKALS
ncbi:hypothetical protein A3L09_10740 (plasmid) [Thermococcus profundus]|uniref:Uncharacterized protein n=2 Tax=Thermococcus profundus TaxID=49899 RepID=A0A2Z2MBL6_THEPR|nr:hypothetical protein A3L09_10740 [Thermococcus profundus]